MFRDAALNAINRRAFLSGGGVALGSLALGSLLARDGVAGGGLPGGGGAGGGVPGLPGLPHFPPRVKRVIFLCMAGGPSQLETFDEKPALAKLSGQPMPASVTAGQPIAQLQGKELRALGPMCKFGRYGRNGQTISDFLPWQQRIADDICIIRSMVAEQINHDPAHTFMNTGTAISGRPSMGAWINYGLGCETSDLPGFVVMTSLGGRNPQPIASRQWSAGFLPSRFQGVEFNAAGAPVHYVDSPPGVPPHLQQGVVEAATALDRARHGVTGNPEIETRIAAYETAFRMQTSVPQLMDVSDEPQHVLDLYGATPGDGSFASNCLLARRLAERGVRFIHLYHRGWDHHDGIRKHMTTCCGLTDQATYALVADLKQRGMLDDTLVIWGGEFGRTPMSQGTTDPDAVGRDHHIAGFTMWIAGGGVRAGTTFGATDDLGYHAVQDPVPVRNLHATMLHLLGVDHRRFTYPFQGLDMKLTGVKEAEVVRGVLA
ncbi:MAG: DUF1501 domain-containing protein [Pirellulales bacterium]|nr:DUF1501 domain-containing protein [Pirellulales bacterium]